MLVVTRDRVLEIEGVIFGMVDKKALLFVCRNLELGFGCPFWEKGLVSPPTSIRTCSPRIHRLGRSGGPDRVGSKVSRPDPQVWT